VASATDNRFFDVHEPYSGKLFARVAAGSAAECTSRCGCRIKAFAGWSETAPAERAAIPKSGRDRQAPPKRIAEVLARETGSTIHSADIPTGPGRPRPSTGRGLGVHAQRRGCWRPVSGHAFDRRPPSLRRCEFTHGTAPTSCRGVPSFTRRRGNTVVVSHLSSRPSRGRDARRRSQRGRVPARRHQRGHAHAPGAAAAHCDESSNVPKCV